MIIQEFGVGGGVHMATGFVVQELDEVGGIDKVAVDGHGQAEWGVDEEWLRFGAT